MKKMLFLVSVLSLLASSSIFAEFTSTVEITNARVDGSNFKWDVRLQNDNWAGGASTII